jgi:hypothetical protein
MPERTESTGPSAVESSALAALGLAVAFVFALTQPTVSRPPPGFPTFMALGFAILACALEAASIAHRVLGARAGWQRTTASILALVVVLIAGGWLVGRAPGREVLLAWMVAPPTIGIAAVLVAGRRGSWSAVAFLALSGILVVLLGLRWVGA